MIITADLQEIGERKFVSKEQEKAEQEKAPGEAQKERIKAPEKEKKHAEKKDKPEKKDEKKTDEEALKKIRENEKKTQKRRTDRGKFLQAAEDSLESANYHDMRDQALGQISSVGGNVDYDELHRMAKSGIRDSAELVQESLGNDGFDADVAKIQKMMEGYVHEGRPDINAIAALEREYSPGEIAQAYVNTALGCGTRDLDRLERIDEAFDFDRPVYEREFDMIRSRDRNADALLDRISEEFGYDRER